MKDSNPKQDQNQDQSSTQEGKSIDTSRLGRALQMGKLAAKITGSAVLDRFKFNQDKSINESVIDATKKNAKLMVKTMGELKGAAMKLGQFLSTDPDLIDEEFARELAVLQKEAPPVPFKEIEKSIEKRLNQKISDLFQYIDPKPLGTASIGQVHYAILKDGREVAVKVQYEGIKSSLDSDLNNIALLLKLGRVLLSPEQIQALIEEIRKALTQEADYLQEAQNLIHFASLFQHIEGIRIPKPILDYCTAELLVMEFMEGQPLVKAIQQIPSYEQRSKIAKRFVDIFVYAFHDLYEINIDPHPGNFLLNQNHEIVLLDFGCIKTFDPMYTDGILKVLVAFWEDDMPKLKAELKALHFGRDGMAFPSDDAVRTHHQMILAPMAKREAFNFSRWQIHAQLRAFLSEHPEFINMLPPPELLMYFRVVAGIKGTLSQIDAGIDLRGLAEDVCVRKNIFSRAKA
jgi:predicted unusual protein kinase regulating ubiquinone biosynthesis (AarF/ABC1/UbiB family)